MSTFHFTCDCGREDSADPNSPRGQARECFRCHISGVSFSFRGPAGGRDSFHNDTIQGLQQEELRAAEASGDKIRLKNKVNGAFALTPAAGGTG